MGSRAGLERPPGQPRGGLGDPDRGARCARGAIWNGPGLRSPHFLIDKVRIDLVEILEIGGSGDRAGRRPETARRYRRFADQPTRAVGISFADRACSHGHLLTANNTNPIQL